MGVEGERERVYRDEGWRGPLTEASQRGGEEEGGGAERCDMCHKLLTQHALFVLESMQKRAR